MLPPSTPQQQPRAQPQEVTPPDVVLLKRELAGLHRAQGVNATEARAMRIGELEYALQRHEGQRR